jgi:ribosome-associated protein
MNNFEMNSMEAFMKDKYQEIIIPENEYKLIFSRSSSKGGQNVNKRETRVQLIFSIGSSKVLNDEQKQKLREILPTLGYPITENDELILESQEERSQWQNREKVIKKLNDLINKALKPEKERIPTEPTKSSKERRIQEKKRRGEIKKMRKINIDDL